jgi:hypothetical protein
VTGGGFTCGDWPAATRSAGSAGRLNGDGSGAGSGGWIAPVGWAAIPDRRRGVRQPAYLLVNLVDLAHGVCHRPGMLGALELGERRLSLQAAERRPSVAHHVADHAAEERAEQHRGEAEGLRDRPVGTDRRQRGGAERRAEDDAAGDAAGEDRVRPAVCSLGRPLEDARIEIREIVRRHESGNRRTRHLS